MAVDLFVLLNIDMNYDETHLKKTKKQNGNKGMRIETKSEK